jgi:hypothetical protein
MLARSKLAEVAGTEPVHIGTSSGVGSRDLKWRVQISPAGGESTGTTAGRRLVSVVVSIFPPHPKADDPIVELQSFAFVAEE